MTSWTHPIPDSPSVLALRRCQVMPEVQTPLDCLNRILLKCMMWCPKGGTESCSICNKPLRMTSVACFQTPHRCAGHVKPGWPRALQGTPGHGLLLRIVQTLTPSDTAAEQNRSSCAGRQQCDVEVGASESGKLNDGESALFWSAVSLKARNFRPLSHPRALGASFHTCLEPNSSDFSALSRDFQ